MRQQPCCEAYALYRTPWQHVHRTLATGLSGSTDDHASADAQMADVEKQYVDSSQRLRKEFETKLVEVRRAGEEDVHLRMNAGTKRVMQHNRSLQEELRIHIEVGLAGV